MKVMVMVMVMDCQEAVEGWALKTVQKSSRMSEDVRNHYKPLGRFLGDCDVQRRDLRIFLKGEAPSLLF